MALLRRSGRLSAVVSFVFVLCQPAAARAGDCADGGDLSFTFKGECTPQHLHPGEEFTFRFSILSSREVEGFSFLLDWNEEEGEFLGATQLHRRPDGEPFEVQVFEVNTENAIPNGDKPHRGEETLEEGYIRGEILFSSVDPTFNIRANELTPLFDFRFRALPDSQSSTVDLGFKDLYTPAIVTYHNTVTVCGAVRHDGREHDSCTPSVVPEGDCIPGNALDVSYSLEDAISIAGGNVTVPFRIRATERVNAYSFSIDFDEEVLEATQIEFVHRKSDGEPWAFQRARFDNSNQVPGNGGIDEGFLEGTVVFSFTSYAYALPAHVENRVNDFHFTVRPEARATSTEVRFLDGARSPGIEPNLNNAAICGQTVNPPEAHSFVFVNGVIGIIDEITIFRRGDANGDEVVNLSDAIRTLMHLFQGGARPVCYDAADADDDGTIDISDPIATLEFLFVGAGPLPPPLDAPGEDPTPDSLGCIGRTE